MMLEIFTAGFGVAGTLSIVCFVMYFFGGIIAGTADWWSVVLFAAGIGFLIAEMFIPGFGIFGIAGIIMFILGLLFSSSSFDQFINRFAIAIGICIVAVPILF